jgi:lipopolysaccharide export system permease protein|tara:strand:+ start:523 stop:1656 length:1134 start_codon:yes stop_codon:yes gene_type:complete
MYFTVTLFALAAIVWTIQAVNYLDLVTDDGHAFAVYFAYSFISLSKVLTKLIPFCFLLALLLTITKLEQDNELIILWTSGLNKIHVVNLILRISLIIMFLQLLLTSFFNPTLLNFSRTLLKNSELQFIPSLLKKKSFNDTVEGLTIFVGDRDENSIYQNIFIRDEGSVLSNVGDANTSSTIIAKSGEMSNDEKNLILYDGNIQKLNSNGEVSIVKFQKTILKLSDITTKSVSEPKMQETSTIQILRCLKNNYQPNNVVFNVVDLKENIKIHNCDGTKKSLMDNKIEFNKRIGMPIYIPLISLICCFLLASRRDKKMFNYNKYIFFFFGFLILILAEIIVRYSGTSLNHSFFYYLIPLGSGPIIYFTLIRTFKYENLS